MTSDPGPQTDPSGVSTADVTSGASESASDPDTTATTTSDSSSTTDASGSSGSSSTGEALCEADWWDMQWTRRRHLDVAGTGIVAAADMVALVRLDPSRIDYAQTAAGGDDLRFVGAGGELAYEIEQWVPGGNSTVWLRMPGLTGAGAPVTMYYGNPGAPAASDGAATWPNDYVSVHHLQALGDATGSGHDAGSPTLPMPTSGYIGGAHAFDGFDDSLTVAGESAYDFTTALTVEAWIRVTAFDAAWQAIVTKGDDAWRVQRTDMMPTINFGSDAPNDNLDGTISVDDGLWHHVAIVYGAAVKRVYIDGAQDVQKGFGGPIMTTNDAVVIGANAQMADRNFNGLIDEVRISNVARAPEYFIWHAASMSEPGVVTFDPEQTCG